MLLLFPVHSHACAPKVGLKAGVLGRCWSSSEPGTGARGAGIIGKMAGSDCSLNAFCEAEGTASWALGAGALLSGHGMRTTVSLSDAGVPAAYPGPSLLQASVRPPRGFRA